MRHSNHLRHGRFPRLEDGEAPLQISDLETPAALVDMEILTQNLERMASYTTLHSLALRPHVKTHKSPRIAAEQIERGATGLTCSTLSEVEVMSDVSNNLLLAYPPVGDARLGRLMSIPDAVNPIVAIDSEFAIDQLALIARAADRPVGVYIEVDVGMRRVGVTTIDELVALASLVESRAPLHFSGITFYPGHIRQKVDDQGESIEKLAGDLARFIDALHSEGMPPEVVSGGSTPAAWAMHLVSGVTEVRPGTYAYNDRITVDTGACTWDDCALTILTTVVSTAVPGQAVVDAGSKALGREPMAGGEKLGYGALLDNPDVRVMRMSEEHGILDLSNTSWRPSVGDQLRIVPNHVCYVVNLNDIVFGIRGTNVETSWPVAARAR